MSSINDVPSPCSQVCSMGEDGLCGGCGRTLDEISRWIEMSNEEKEAVWQRLQRLIE